MSHPAPPKGTRVLRALHVIADGFERWRGRRPLEVGSLHDAAMEIAGLEDFGDPDHRRPLACLTASLEDEARLTPLGRSIARIRLVGHLVNRLRLIEDRKRVPAIASVPIERPIFIIGPPRTGTSILFRLLAQSESILSPLAWQLQTPSPPPPRHAHRRDMRYRRAHADELFLRFALPELRAIRDTRAELPEECCVLQAHAFVSIVFTIAFDVPSYERALLRDDHRESYAWHHRFLQQLQWGSGTNGRWLLKSPGHLISLPALFERYPDACVVQTHRDPLSLVPSLCSLSAVLRGLSSEPGDPRDLGERVSAFWAAALERTLDFRRDHPELANRFFDVRFEAIERDPSGVARAVRNRFGPPLAANDDERAHRFLAAHPRDRFGRHDYRDEAYGLRPELEAKRFERYRAQLAELAAAEDVR